MLGLLCQKCLRLWISCSCRVHYVPCLMYLHYLFADYIYSSFIIFSLLICLSSLINSQWFWSRVFKLFNVGDLWVINRQLSIIAYDLFNVFQSGRRQKSDTFLPHILGHSFPLKKNVTLRWSRTEEISAALSFLPPGPVAIGGPCQLDEQCLALVENAHCSGGVCACAPDFIQEGLLCRFGELGYGARLGMEVAVRGKDDNTYTHTYI